MQGLHCPACAVLTSCYLSARTQALWPLPAIDGTSFFTVIYNLRFPMGGVNGLWATYVPRIVGDFNYREVKGQVKGQGSVDYTL